MVKPSDDKNNKKLTKKLFNKSTNTEIYLYRKVNTLCKIGEQQMDKINYTMST